MIDTAQRIQRLLADPDLTVVEKQQLLSLPFLTRHDFPRVRVPQCRASRGLDLFREFGSVARVTFGCHSHQFVACLVWQSQRTHKLL